MIAFILSAFFSHGLAVAQSWKEYTFPKYAISVSFLAKPTTGVISYQAADGRSVIARVYSVTSNNGVLKLMIADMPDATLSQCDIISHAVKTLSRGGEIESNILYHVQQVYGRQISITGADGSYSSVALFYYKRRLYQIEGKVFRKGNDTSANAVRFQHSFNFTNPAIRGPPRSRSPACRGSL